MDSTSMLFWYIMFLMWLLSPITSNLWKSIDNVLEWCYVGSIDNKWYCLLLWLSFTVDYSCGPGHLLLLLFLTTSTEHWNLKNTCFFSYLNICGCIVIPGYKNKFCEMSMYNIMSCATFYRSQSNSIVQDNRYQSHCSSCLPYFKHRIGQVLPTQHIVQSIPLVLSMGRK